MAAAQVPRIRHIDSFNNALNVLKVRGTSAGGAVRYLGRHALQGCQMACVASVTRCWSYVRLKASAECYGILHPGWSPSADSTAESGYIEWSCRNDEDCSLNGRCIEGHCKCRDAWSGSRCHTLMTLPAQRSSGYHRNENGHNTSSWGGAVLRGSDGLYHMWVSEITEHCGIGAWKENSRIVHATSPTADGVYTRQGVVWPVFAHEPQVVPGPNGEYVMYFTAASREDGGLLGWCHCCRNEEGPCDGSTGPGDCPSLAAPYGKHATFMSWTTDPNGNWSWPERLFASNIGGDTNFSPLLLSNGSMLGLWRKWGVGNGGSRIFVATAPHWRNTTSYAMHRFTNAPRALENQQSPKKHRRSAELFPELGPAGTEDQFIYQDYDGNYHAYFHNMYGTASKDKWWLDATGGHAFSRDGWTWTYTGVAWGCVLCRYDKPEGQGALVLFEDGGSFRFTRIERPHLIFAGRKLRGDPRYLVVAAQYGAGTDASTRSQNGDASYTLILPIRASGSMKTNSRLAGREPRVPRARGRHRNIEQSVQKSREHAHERISTQYPKQWRGRGPPKLVHSDGPLKDLDELKRQKLWDAVCAHCANAGAFCALSCITTGDMSSSGAVLA